MIVTIASVSQHFIPFIADSPRSGRVHCVGGHANGLDPGFASGVLQSRQAVAPGSGRRGDAGIAVSSQGRPSSKSAIADLGLLLLRFSDMAPKRIFGALKRKDFHAVPRREVKKQKSKV